MQILEFQVFIFNISDFQLKAGITSFLVYNQVEEKPHISSYQY